MKIIHYICANWGKTTLSMPCKNPQKNVQIYFLFENLFVHLHCNFKNVVIMEKVFDFKNGQLSIVDGVRFVEAKMFAEEALDFTLAQVKELIIPQSVRGVEVFALEGFCNLEKLTVPAHLLGEDEGLYSNRSYYTRSFTRMLTNRRNRWVCLNLKTVVVMADEDGVIDFTHYYAPTKAETFCEGELKKLIFAEDLCGTYFINARVEDVEVEGVDKELCPNLFFRAPKADATPAEGVIISLTLAPRFTGRKYSGHLWSRPCKLHSRAVTFVVPVDLPCYEGTKEGCRLMLLGPLFRKKNLKDLANVDEYPYIIVWEDYATVLRKLTEAGWGQ